RAGHVTGVQTCALPICDGVAEAAGVGLVRVVEDRIGHALVGAAHAAGRLLRAFAQAPAVVVAARVGGGLEVDLLARVLAHVGNRSEERRVGDGGGARRA